MAIIYTFPCTSPNEIGFPVEGPKSPSTLRIYTPSNMDGIKYLLGPEALKGRNFGYNFA